MHLISSKIKEFHLAKKLFQFSLLITFFFVHSCSTIQPQYGKQVDSPKETFQESEIPTHRFFLIGDTGDAGEPASTTTFEFFKSRIDKADSASTVIFLGDNIYPNGMPDENSNQRKKAEQKLQLQIDLLRNFKGQTFFIPGNHDWYSGIKGLKAQEAFVTAQLGKKTFQPNKACPIDSKKISDEISLIFVDSQWYLEDWDKHKNMNADCDLKTRDEFLEEFESELNKNQNQLTIIAIHHPLLSGGTHAGQFSWSKQLFPFEAKIPLPLIGSFINLLRKTSGGSPQDNQNHIYREFINRLKTLVADRENLIFVSGHDHNLQYLESENIKQIISGAASKDEAARAVNPNDFSAGWQGYAVLDVFNDGSSKVYYYGNKNGSEKLLFEHSITEKRPVFTDFIYENEFKATEVSQIYTDEMTRKSGFYQFLFGKHYRKYYSTPVEVPVLDLSNEYNGLTAIRAGGGHQTNSIRLVDSFTGKEYSLRALKKSASRFIQALAFREQYVARDFEETFTEDFLLDFYTTTHPYYPFVIGELAAPIGIYHTNPRLFYVENQNNLGIYNKDFEPGLYMLEERPMRNFNDTESFGSPQNIISTSKLFENLRSDEKYKIDEKSYIRARLFDMLIGDWDRHSDQWRWSEFSQDEKIIYKPIPRDRDQVFPKYDGFLISMLMQLPALRHMQNFGANIRNVKWFNMEPYPMDLALIRSSGIDDWLAEAKFIKENLTDEIIDRSFRNIPENMKDETVLKIKELIKIRKTKLSEFAEKYYKVLKKTVVLHATDKDDKILIERQPGGITKVQMFRLKKSGEELFFSNSYNHKETREIRIYGLNDEDVFELSGEGDNYIKIRLMGGAGKDSYHILNGRKVRIYDNPNDKDDTEKAQKAKLNLTEDYDLNRYNYTHPKYNVFSTLPSVGYNPDDGVKAGLSFNYVVNGFKRDKFTTNHNLLLNYYFATRGFEAVYTGDFMKLIGKWNLGLTAVYTSAAYTHNFFGYGNETENFEDDLGMDYNRVRIQSLNFRPNFYKTGRNNGRIEFGLGISDLKVEKTAGRIVEVTPEIPTEIFDHNQLGEVYFRYSFSNYDNRSMPVLGMSFSAEAHWETNFSQSGRSLPWLAGSFGFTHPISRGGILNFSTLFKGKTLLNNHFEFYQAASIGGESDLRAYRFDRFTGKSSLVHSTDLNLRLGKAKTVLLPIYYGISAGYDYGRVWIPNEASKVWHQSYGGGIWFNAVKTLTGKINYFHGKDGGRFSFNLIFGF